MPTHSDLFNGGVNKAVKKPKSKRRTSVLSLVSLYPDRSQCQLLDIASLPPPGM